MTIVLVNLYGSTLISYLTVTKLKSIPNSLEELAASYEHQKCLLTMQKSHFILTTFQVGLIVFIMSQHDFN